ncbi:MAG TPA: redoxin domain-containing protein, partial [Mesotoga sp.]|nr:redoxin domain-containing protein [Mesotoga sp.]HQC57398.1 redoxin domain-containing protein [Mesotoga sp.]
MYGRAVEFPDSGTWLNVDEPLSMEKLKGHVVLLDFWTYCCINCIHVIADLKWLEARFSNKPLVVIGVHSAKFENERQERNIQAAIQRYGIAHPVFVDNEYHLWDRYAIRA